MLLPAACVCCWRLWASPPRPAGARRVAAAGSARLKDRNNTIRTIHVSSFPAPPLPPTACGPASLERRHRAVLDPRRILLPRPLPAVRLVLGPRPLEPHDLRIPLEGEDVRGQAVEEPPVVAAQVTTPRRQLRLSRQTMTHKEEQETQEKQRPAVSRQEERTGGPGAPSATHLMTITHPANCGQGGRGGEGGVVSKRAGGARARSRGAKPSSGERRAAAHVGDGVLEAAQRRHIQIVRRLVEH